MPKIFIVAGEPSGDTHGAKLMNKLKEINNNIQFYGIGGPNMEKSGLKSIIPLKKISVIGFTEVVKKLPLFLKLKEKCESIMLEEQVDCFIPIDYPGFNIKLVSFAKKQKIPTYYYIAPQLWAWGKNRWKKLQSVEKLLVVLPFEEEYFKERGIKTKFVGHPLLDNPIFNSKEKERDNKLIAFFAGSRIQEVKHNLLLFANTAKNITKQRKNLKFGFAVSTNIQIKEYDILKKYHINYELFHNSYDLMQQAIVGIVKAGTTTLEATLLKMNMIVAYKTSTTHYLLGKKLINLNHIALPNILANKQIVDEYIQKNANPIIMADAILKILDDENYRQKQKQEFDLIKEKLGTTSASLITAKSILENI